MEMKYDSYYETDLPYKMTLEEMFERKKNHCNCLTDRDLLAYIRYKGDKVRFYAPASFPENITNTPFGFALVSSGKEKKALCRLLTEKDDEKYEDSSYNPLIEKSVFSNRLNNWYHAYKLSITPVEFNGVIEEYYVSDFCSLVEKGIIEIWEMEG